MSFFASKEKKTNSNSNQSPVTTSNITKFAATQLKDGAIELMAGTMAGVANVYAGQPLDTVKVKMQTFPHLYSNWINCLNKTARFEGIRGLYAGSVPALAANISENAVLFTAYDYCQKIIVYLSNGTDCVDNMSSLQNACSGSLAAFFAALVLCPTELVKCRLQAQRELDPNIKSTPFSVCRNILKTEGIFAFGTGMGITIARDVFGYFFFFGGYELCRQLLAKEGQHKNDIGLMKTAIAGSVGGVSLWGAAFQTDVIKSRMQIRGGTTMQVTKDILRTEGFTGLYKGLVPTLIRATFATPFLFIAHEKSKKLLHSYL